MKGLICVFILTLSNISLPQNYPHLFELRGLEDSLGNTHLFYRYVPQMSGCWSKNIYHYDLSTNVDTLFIRDFGYEVYQGWGCEGNYIFDYEFFDNDPAKYIYGGYNLWIDPTAIIKRYDSEIQQLAIGAITEIEISEQNDNLVYAALGGGLFKSTDGGYNFEINIDSLAWVENAMISMSKNDDSQIYGIDQNKLVRSEDEGHSYIIVDDDSHWSWTYEKELYYDADGQHIYGISTSSTKSAFLVSDGNGDPFTWNLKLTKPGKIWFTLDEQYQGEIYYSYNKSIYISTDFGNSFLLYKELEQKITGLYKKSNTDILYASTKFRIYEITPDSMHVIKSLPIPDEVFNYYPLAVGNKWVYTQEVHDVWSSEVVYSYILREVIGDTVMNNSKKYSILKEYDGYWNEDFLFYERVDSGTGLVYRYSEDSTQSNDEYLIENLLSEIGDIITTYRLRIYPESGPFQFIHSTNNFFNDFGLNKGRKVYSYLESAERIHHSLTESIGLDSIIIDLLDIYTSFVDLKGCIINGVVYGDTTVVSVEDETPNLPTEFSLSQNYPNPFNPSTTIKFSVPQQTNVVLKVYDILGSDVANLVNETLYAGNYTINFNASQFASGMYIYKITAGNFVTTKKMILLK